MTKRIGGSRRKTRALLRKNVRLRGKISLRRMLAQYNPGQRVALVPEPAVQESLFEMRFYGRPAVVCGKRGSCYEVEFKDGDKTKTLYVHPVHLKPLPAAAGSALAQKSVQKAAQKVTQKGAK